MVTPKLLINPSKEPLYGAAFEYQPNLKLFETTYVPKIKKYQEDLANAIPKTFLIPDALIPDDLDNTPFNATLIPAKVLDAKSLEITEYTTIELAKKIASKEFSALEVIKAFAKRAAIAHQLTNCAMEVFFEDGYKRAQELDDHLEKTGKTVGPLHGIPISLKENLGYPGRITHAGFVSCIDNIAEKFCLTTQILYDLGAVFYIRTTEPQSLMHLDSLNNIVPRGRNCYKTTMSPGGSSSGEGAILGMRGSSMGLGSDIGGSVRGPAAFNGVYGLKPSSRRISSKGIFKTAEQTASDFVVATIGPFSNSVEDLEYFMKAYIEEAPWKDDEYVVPIPWREVAIPEAAKLTVGIVYDDGVVKPHPPIIRALKLVEKKLRAAGVNVIVWEPHRVYDCVQIASTAFTADGNYGSKQRFEKSGEPLVPLTKHFLSFGKGDKGLSALEFEYYTNLRDIVRSEYNTLFDERKVDIVLAPTYVGTAPKPSTVKYWGYTVLWNLLDLSCVTIPSGVFSNKELDPKDDTYKPRNVYEEYEYGLYDPEASDGLPVGLTLVGKRYTEEKSLKVAKVVDDILKN